MIAESKLHYDFEKKYCKLLKANKALQLEKDYFESQLYEKEKILLEIQGQLNILKRKFHHHKAEWLQIAEDNKNLKRQLFQLEGTSHSAALQTKLNSLVKKIFHDERVKSEEKALGDLVKQGRYKECLQEIIQIFNDYVDETYEKSYSGLKGFMGESLEKAVSPIYQEVYTDDEEIDKLMDESKLLLQTLEKQNLKLSSLNEEINSDFNLGRFYE